MGKSSFFIALFGLWLGARVNGLTEINRYSYGEQEEFLSEWNQLGNEDWFDLKLWKETEVSKRLNPNWRENTYLLAHKQIIGRILYCEGECKSYRGGGFAFLKKDSLVREGDDLLTSEKSFLWIQLVDGSILQFFPMASMSFREFNFTKEKFFFFLRLNYGPIFYLNRNQNLWPESNLMPTDQMIAWPQGRFSKWLGEYEKKFRLEQILKTSKESLKKVSIINDLIKKNKNWMVHRPTQTLFVTPHGHILGEEMKIMVFSDPSAETTFKFIEWPLGTKSEVDAKFYYRGYLSHDVSRLRENIYYQTADNGRSLEEKAVLHKEFWPMEFLLRRPYALLYLRELGLRKYSRDFFTKDPSEVLLREQKQVHLWKENMQRLHLKYLLEYTRRIETSQMSIAKNYFSHLEEEDLKKFRWSKSTYHDLWLRYLKLLENFSDVSLPAVKQDISPVFNK